MTQRPMIRLVVLAVTVLLTTGMSLRADDPPKPRTGTIIIAKVDKSGKATHCDCDKAIHPDCTGDILLHYAPAVDTKDLKPGVKVKVTFTVLAKEKEPTIHITALEVQK